MPQTSPAKTSKRPLSRASKGFTLIEIMVVLGLVAAMVMMVLPRLTGRNNQMRQTVRRLSALTRELESTAKLQGAIYRLVLDLGVSGMKSNPQSYWVEKSTSRTVLSPEEMEEFKESTYDSEEEREAKKAANTFAADSRFQKAKSEMPPELIIEDVELRRKEGPITEGKVYIHFYPQGLADEAVIHLKAGDKLRWSLLIHPLTGKTNVLSEHVALKEFTGK